MSYRKYLMTRDELPSELYKATEVGTNLAEVGTDAISRQDALDIYDDYNIAVENGEIEAYGRFRKQLAQLPPIQPKRGKWIRDGHHIRCDQCGIYMCDTDREGDKIPNNFCPNCGSYNGGKINDQ